MVKIKGPMMSMAASGTLADAITFSTWKGRPYVRERVIPANPKSGAQTGRRAMLAFLSQTWSGISEINQATWQELADQLVASKFNAYLSENMESWHNFIVPTQATPPKHLHSGSDNVLTAAIWEENRIKLTLEGANIKQNWGIIIFAKKGGAVTPAVGNAILVKPDITVAEHHIFWTPPEVATWHFNSRTFSDDQLGTAAGGAQNAAP